MLGVRNSLMVSAAVVCVAAAQPAKAQQRQFNVPSQEISRAIPELARQAGIQIVAPADGLENVRSRPVQGTMDVRVALRRMLEDTGLAIASDRNGVILLRIQPTSSSAPGQSPSRAPGETGAGSAAAESESAEQQDQTITVTGSRIRGAQPSSPVVTITQDDMRQAGHNNLGEVIRAIPQNFAGGQNPGVLTGAANGSVNQNLTGSSGLNLRGLGPDATLTLLNGMRLPYDGYTQASDVSVIPVVAIERVEILLDGASAIYGSDAVGGVANIILRRDFRGAEFSARLGAATDGGYEQQQYTGIAGHNWGTGGFLVTGDYSRNTSVRASQRAYTATLPVPGTTLYPRVNQRGGLFSGHQQISDFAELAVDAFYTDRRNDSVIGTTRRIQARADTTIWGIGPRIRFRLPSDWTAQLYGFLGNNESEVDQRVFNLTTGAQTSQTIIGLDNRSYAAGVEAEGPLFALPGGDARLALGGGWRRNSLDLTGGLLTNGTQSIYNAYGEVGFPLISPDQSVPFVNRLVLNGAMRYEHYDTFGGTVTPKVGLVWAPVRGFDIRATWGRSFKAPTLRQQNDPPRVTLYPANFVGGPAAGAPANATVLYLSGGNPNLTPEEAETLAVGFVARPDFLSGLRVELNWFRVNYTDRVVEPISVFGQGLTDPAYAAFVARNPNPDQIIAAFAFAGLPEGTLPGSNFSDGPYDRARVFAILNNYATNAAVDIKSGIDLNVQFTTRALGGELSLDAAGSWITSARRTVTRSGPETPTAGFIFFPARFKGQAGASWSRNGLALSTTINHISGVVDNNVVPNIRRGSMTTVGLVVDYETNVRQIGNLGFTLAISNLFDEHPPFMQPSLPFYANFDSTNYSPLGRVISATIRTRF